MSQTAFKKVNNLLVLRVDLRDRKRSRARHMPVPSLKKRANFKLRPGQSGLNFTSVWSTDDGLYRCRVDFKVSPTRNSWILLSVIGE